MPSAAFNPPQLWLWRGAAESKRTLFVYNFKSKKVLIRRDLSELCVQTCGEPVFTNQKAKDLFHGEPLQLKNGWIDLILPAQSVRIFPLE